MKQNECPSCGKPYPAGQTWCNWCESGWREGRAASEQAVSAGRKRSVLSPDYATDSASIGQSSSLLKTLLVWIYKLIVICFGLLLIMGGGVLGLCGANGRGNDWILVVIGFLPLALGGFLIAIAFKPARKQSEGMAVANPSRTDCSSEDRDVPPKQAARH